jgi:hypothetical protein
MSYDALMRWEWEGGTPVPVSERGEALAAEKAEHGREAQVPDAVEIRQPVVPASRPAELTGLDV